MASILELKTGLFPDSKTVAQALVTLKGTDSVKRLDVTCLKPDDTEGWDAAATAILSAHLVVTL